MTRSLCRVYAIVPGDKQARARHFDVKKDIGFDPIQSSHELRASKLGAKNDAKRVRSALVESEEVAFSALEDHTPMHPLRERDQHNGLCEQLDELEDALRAAQYG